MSFGVFSQERSHPAVGSFYDQAVAEGVRYAETVNRLARAFIYDKVPVEELAKKLHVLKDPRTGDRGMAAFEAERGSLEAMLHFCRGVEQHERANKIHGGPWQKNLIDQPGTHSGKPIQPEQLTREQVAKEFTAFDLREDLLSSEQRALSAYRTFLASSAEPIIPLSNNIKIKRVDVQALINDLEVRLAERVPNPEERRKRLLALNRELLALIQDVPDEDVGKRFELQEIYLLRRLIQTADTGHLVSVNHGTPRQDLNINEASVDLVITFAGRIDLQIKTYKARVSSHTLQQQKDELAYREQTLQGTETQLRVLRAEAVRESFERTLRQDAQKPTTLKDKKTVFAPLLEELNADQSTRLTTLLGLTEERCDQEQREFERSQREYNERVSPVLERRSREMKVIHEAEQAALKAEAERVAKKNAEIEEARAASELKRQRAAVAKEEHREAKKKPKEDEREQVQVTATALPKPRGWSARPIETLCDAPTLRRLGFLPETGGVTPDGLRAAKQVFWKVLPPDVFFEVFPDKKKFEKPTPEQLARVRALLGAYKAEQQSEAAE